MFHGVAYLYLVAAIVVGSSAFGHTPGLSTADFVLTPEGTVDAILVLAGREAFAWGSLDGNHDGLLSDEEVDAARPDLTRLAREGIEVTADGEACAPTFEGATVAEGDGLQIAARYRCPAIPSRVAVTLYFLTELGPTHRAVTRLSAGQTHVDQVLTGTERAITLVVPPEVRPSSASRKGFGLWLGLGAVAGAGLVALGLWRRRPRRRRARR